MSDTPTPQEELSPLIGQKIGKYKIVRQLGRGGMGAVYAAVHEDIGQGAAIKVMHAELSREPKFARRFFDEAKAVSKVQHPGLIKIFDFNALPDGTLYLMMELLKGELLWDRIQRFRERPEGGAFPLPDALRIARQLASALAAVHQEGIVHRDLKHENVFLVSDPDTPSGERAKILDFGIAKDAAAQGRRTTAGVVIGTPGYMSPEQCAGSSQITDRADVYSLGVMLFEMLTGQPPFEADSVAALMARHITKAPPPLPASVPAAVAALTREMLAKEPGQRPSMQQIQERIDGLSPLGSGHAVLGGLRHEATLLHRAKPFLLAACGLSAAIGLGVTLWLQTAHQRSLPPPPAKPVQSAPPEPPKQQTPAPPEPDESGPVASAAPTSGSEDKPAKRDKPGKAGKSNKMPAGLWGDRKRKPAGSH